MLWKNVLKDKCPKCNKKLHLTLGDNITRCYSKRCDFFIKNSNLEILVRKLETEKLRILDKLLKR